MPLTPFPSASAQGFSLAGEPPFQPQKVSILSILSLKRISITPLMPICFSI